MKLTGEHVIPMPRERVWEMLNDPDVLRECLPGCEEFSGTPDEGYAATLKLKIGPVKATFNGEVALSDINPPESYTISGAGKGGIAGFASGNAEVRLMPEGDGTKLDYIADAKVGGKLAQLGSRLIQSTAKKLSGQFFEKFAEMASNSAEGIESGDDKDD